MFVVAGRVNAETLRTGVELQSCSEKGKHNPNEQGVSAWKELTSWSGAPLSTPTRQLVGVANKQTTTRSRPAAAPLGNAPFSREWPSCAPQSSPNGIRTWEEKILRPGWKG